jgi:Zn-dependent protease
MTQRMLPLGRYFGIRVYLHWTFVFAVAWVGYMGWQAGFDTAQMLGMQGLLFVIFSFVLLHEFGHALAAKWFQVETREIVLSPIGGIAFLVGMPRSPWAEFVIALAGPLVNLTFAGIFWGLDWGLVRAGLWDEESNFLGYLLQSVIQINLILFAFNLIPAFPMDGGRILRAALAALFDFRRATWCAVRIGQGAALAGIAYGLVRPQWQLMLIGVFVLIIGNSELHRLASEKEEADLGPAREECREN